MLLVFLSLLSFFHHFSLFWSLHQHLEFLGSHHSVSIRIQNTEITLRVILNIVGFFQLDELFEEVGQFLLRDLSVVVFICLCYVGLRMILFNKLNFSVLSFLPFVVLLSFLYLILSLLPLDFLSVDFDVVRLADYLFCQG